MPRSRIVHAGAGPQRRARSRTTASSPSARCAPSRSPRSRPRHGELLWDIGLGAGSIAIEWLLCDPSLRAIGIEERADARRQRGAQRRRARRAGVCRSSAAARRKRCSGLPAPDAVFIGGGLGDGVLDAAWAALKPGGRMVANAVTLEGESALLAAFQRFGGELSRIDIARADSIGGLHGWRPAMPVTQWRAVKP